MRLFSRPVVLIALHFVLAACSTPEVLEDPLANLELPRGSGVELEGVKIYYRDVGSGTPIVLLHGAGLDSRMWIGQISALSDKYRVISLDLPGFGHSPIPRDAYSHTVTLAYLLDHLRVQRAHVVGISDGAQDAIDFSYRFPDSAITLTLASPRLDGQEWSAVSNAISVEIMSASVRGNARRAANLWLGHPMFASARGNPHLEKRVRAIHFDNKNMWVRSTFPQRPEPRAIQRLREIQVPTLVLVGDQDVESVYEIARKIDRQAVDSRLEVVPRAGHLVNMETPEVFNRLLREFLGDHPATRAPAN